MKLQLMVAGVCLSVVALASDAPPATAQDSGGSCYFNPLGQHCADLDGLGYWSGCNAPNDSEGVKPWVWASINCTTYHSG